MPTPTLVHHTFWLLAGSSEYAEPVPAALGATADCLGLRDDLLAFGYPAEQVLSFCGTALVKNDIVTAVNGLSGRLSPGDTLVVYWVGHGGVDPEDPVQKFWHTSDGLTVGPLIFDSALRRAIPSETNILFLTDTARDAGPSAGDFVSVNPRTVVASPLPGIKQPGALREIIRGCLRRNLAMADDNQLSLAEAGTCLGVTSSATPVPMIGGGDWASLTTPIIHYPPEPKLAQKPLAVKPIARWSGLGLGVVSAVAGGVTYVEARSIYDSAESQNFLVSESMRGDVERYDDLRLATYVLWGVGVAGLATFGGTYLTVTPAPHGLTIQGSF